MCCLLKQAILIAVYSPVRVKENKIFVICKHNVWLHSFKYAGHVLVQIKQTPGCNVAMAGRICIINNSYHETFFMKFSVVLSDLRASTKAANIEEVDCVLLANTTTNPSHCQEFILVLLAK